RAPRRGRARRARPGCRRAPSRRGGSLRSPSSSWSSPAGCGHDEEGHCGRPPRLGPRLRAAVTTRSVTASSLRDRLVHAHAEVAPALIEPHEDLVAWRELDDAPRPGLRDEADRLGVLEEDAEALAA